MTATAGVGLATARSGGLAGPLLVIDTATSVAIVALGDGGGNLLAAATWPAGQRHSEELLPRIEGLLAETGITPAGLGAIVVGTGPGAFTGLRVGLATAKTLAHQLDIPLVGVSSAEALLATAAGESGSPILLLPAGSSDRIAVPLGGPARLLPGGRPLGVPGELLAIAVDLPDRAEPEAVARGERAQAGLAAALARLGARRLAAGDRDDPERLVPDYVTLPRGVGALSGEIEWSRDSH